MKALYYFRNDLRLQDNPLLNEACEKAHEIAFVAKAPDSNWGVWRQKFHWECLKDIQDQLKEYGQELLVLKDPLNEIDLTAFDILFTPLINASFEREEVANLVGINEIRSYWTDRLLLQLPYPVSSLPDIFTEFRKGIEKDFCPLPPLASPKSWPKGIKIEAQKLEAPLFPIRDSKSAFPFSGGERSALKRLQDYTFDSNLVATYKKTRNGLIGPDYSTKFSPYLALGCLSPHRIFYVVEQYEKEIKKNQDTYWVKFELWWRDYFRWVFEKYQVNFFMAQGLKRKALPSTHNLEVFTKWKEGHTGDDFVDANMKELLATGFMSNRGRQNVASYLVKDLGLPWKWGAEYFENELIDYDVFSNWGNWQYVAGVGNDPRPNRYFNTQKQASMYDPDAKYRRLWND